MSKQFEVPIQPHLKKFILKQYKLKEPIKVEEYSVLGKVVMGALMDKRNSVELNKLTSHRGTGQRDLLTDTLRIILSKGMSERAPRLHKLVRINIDMHRIFKDYMLVWIIAQHDVGIPPNTSCKRFLEKYGIDENEYSYDAAWKYWMRYKNGDKKAS